MDILIPAMIISLVLRSLKIHPGQIYAKYQEIELHKVE
jgi:hypothetical protein